MEANGYFAVNSEKTIFMKCEGKQFIIHGLFVVDMMHIATNTRLKNEFMEKYSRDFNITGGGLMKTFLGMEIEQSNRSIKLHLDHYIRKMLNEYKAYIKKSLQPKRVPFSPGVVLRPEDSPTLPDPSKQKFYRSFVAKLQFAPQTPFRRSLNHLVCYFVDSLRYLVCSIAVGSILCFGRLNPLGSTSSLDGVR